MLKFIGSFLVASLFVAVPAAHAATIVTFTGNETGTDATAIGSLTLSGDTLSGELTNTSPYDARITAFGFDIGDGNLNGYSGFPNPIEDPGDILFDFSDGDLGNVPQFNFAVLDFGYTTSNSGHFTGGFPNEGLPTGSTLTFTITGDFGGLTEADIGAAWYLRFQRVGLDGEGSDVARGNVIPEPASMILFGTGLVYLARRRMRKTVT